MNEELTVRLNVAGKKKPEIRGLYSRVGKALNAYGFRPDKTEGKYRLVSNEDPSYQIFIARKFLKESDWLKGILNGVSVSRKDCPNKIPEIKVPEGMKADPKVLKQYEEYYIKEKKLPLAFVVNEDNVLVAEPEAYFLAKEIGTINDGDLIRVPNAEKTEKQVLTRTVHLSHLNRKYTLKKNEKIYVFDYELSDPVSEGDILKCQTKFDFDYVTVTGVTYCTDQEQVGVHCKVLDHTGLKLEQTIPEEQFLKLYTEKMEKRTAHREGRQKKIEKQKMMAQKNNRRRPSFS